MWNGVVTNAGLSLLEMWAAGGETLYIDRATAGTGTVAQDNMRSSTHVQGDVGAVPIVASIPVSSGTQYRIQVQPSQTASYILRQLGIWAHLGDNGASTLLALYQDEDGVSVPLEADDPGFNFTLYAIVTMSNQGSINVNYDSSAYVTRDALDEITDGMIKTVNFGGQVYTGDYAGSISIPVDAQPTENSNNTVKSGGVYDAVNTKVSKAGDTMTGSLLIDSSSRYPSYSIVKRGTNTALFAMMLDYNSTSARWFRIRNNTTTYTNDYFLPSKPTDDTDSYSYTILTTKPIEDDITIKGAHRIFFQNASGQNIFRIQYANNRFYVQAYDPNTEGKYTNFRLPASDNINETYEIITTKPYTIANLYIGSANYNGITFRGSASSPLLKISNPGTRFLFDQYLVDENGDAAQYGERYLLPEVSAVTSNQWYSIFTSKTHNMKQKTTAVNSSIAAQTQLYVYTTALTNYTCISAWFEQSSNSNVFIVSQPFLATNSQVVARIFNPATSAATATGTMHFVFVPSSMIDTAS